jgi:hypothetical protein
MNRARTVDGQVRKPAARHHALQNHRCAVAQQVRPVNQDDACALLTGF